MKTLNWILLIIGLFVLAGAIFFLSSRRARIINSTTWNRSDYLKKITEIAKKYQRNANDNKVRLEYARRCFEVGEFLKSRELLQSLLNGPNPPAEAKYLSAHIEYLYGRYAQAEKLLTALVENSPDEIKMKAQIGLLFVYYQTKQYTKTVNLFKGSAGKIQLALWEMMKAFGDGQPYRIKWEGEERAIIPFVVTDPLPVVSVKINGSQIFALIDTGGEMFYLDESVAAALGIKSIAKQVEPFAGGKTIEVGYARADSLTLNGVTLESVPIKIGSIQRFSEVFGHNLVISGVLPTGVLQQFLATIDYPDGRLILRPRNEDSGKSLNQEFAQEKIIELPFVLSMTHLMIGKGSINEKNELNLLIDSGLADSEAALCLPKQTLEYAGIPIPSTEIVSENKGGLAGGGFPVGRFRLEKCGLGSLRQNNIIGLYGVFPPQLYSECEFIIDGIISHQFLKKYKWTIDFDSMKMIFAQKY